MPTPPLSAISEVDEVRPGGAHVLDGDDDVRRHQLEAGFDQQLLGEGVADLHGRALLVRFVVELGRRHRRAVDAVAAGLRADVDDRQADALGGGVEDLVGLREADAHGVDEDVVVVARVEVGLAADGRHAGAIAVAADAGDDAADEVARLGMIGRAEAQRVEVGDGPRAHREHVAHDAADARRRALVGLDVGGVVVALHLEDDRVAVAEIDDARVLAGALDDLRARWSAASSARRARICRSSARSTSPRRCRARRSTARGRGFRAGAGIRPA